MKIQIYYNKTYIPFDLYIHSIYNIFTTHPYFVSNNYEVSIINDIKKYSKDIDYLILYLNYVKDIFELETNNTKIIFIHADYIINHSTQDQMLMYNYLNKKNKDNSYIWDYSILNLKYYDEHFINKKYYFIPLQYNKYLELIYKDFKLNIPHNAKPIDVLFMGSYGPDDRRDLLLKNISKKHNIYIMNHVDDIDNYINIIEKSKIIVNIYSKEMNKPFDHYRLALLYSNKVFVVTEDFYTEDSMLFDKILKDIIIKTDYNNISNCVTEYLSKSEEELELIREKIYKIYKKHDMSENIIHFFTSLL